jgi:hypothetical protein
MAGSFTVLDDFSSKARLSPIWRFGEEMGEYTFFSEGKEYARLIDILVGLVLKYVQNLVGGF